MDRALDHDALTFALGELPSIPSSEELQALIADAELALFRGQAEVSGSTVALGHAQGVA